MFEYSSDSLTDYVSSFPTTPVKPTPIVLERVEDPNSAFDSIIPTTPSQQQKQSIQTGELTALSSSSTNPSSYFSSIQRQTAASASASDLDSESSKLPWITNLYIGSLTVVGLFLLFRMIQK